MRYQFCIKNLILLFCFNVSNAQVAEHQVLDRTNGNLLYIYQQEEIQGSPFLNDDWENANLISDKGYVFKSVKVKLDIYKNKFIFNQHDTSFEVSNDIIAVNLFSNLDDTSKKMIFKRGYSITANIGPDKFLQVLAEGKLSFLKYYQKEMEEFNEYGNANKLKRFKSIEKYYVLQGEQYIVVTPNKKNMESVLQAKWPQIEQFLKQNNMSGKNEKEWVSAITFYNSL